MSKVLVMGGTQFFGKKLVEHLLQDGVDVTIATRGQTKDSFGDKVHRVKIDRENKFSLLEAVGDQYWDIVYDQICQSSQEAMDAIEVFTNKVGRYVFTSTMAVYDFGEQRNERDFDSFHHAIHIKHRTAYEGLSGYQEAKRGAEAVFFQKASFPVVAVRFPLVIGTDDYTNRFQFLVDYIKDEKAFRVKNPDILLSFISSDDAAQFLNFIGKASYVGPINAGSSEDISHKQLMEKIEELTGKAAIVSKDDKGLKSSPYAYPGSLSMDTSTAEEIGFTFQSLPHLIEELINYYI